MNFNRFYTALVMVFCLVVSGAIAGCDDPFQPKNIVTARICADNAKKDCYIVHEEGDEKRIVAVTKAVFDACPENYEWPRCGDGIHNGMRVIQLDNDPYASKQRSADEQNKRTVCVESISHPEAPITNTWFIGGSEPKTESKVQGIFTRCALASPGSTAYIKSERHATPSTLMCLVYVFKGGARWPLDMVITQALGDCEATHVIPPK